MNVAALKAELLEKKNTFPLQSQADLEKDLGQYYLDAQKLDSGQYHAVLLSNASLSIASIGGGILGKVKAFICSLLTDASSDSDIIDAILKALASIIPGGIIFQFIAGKLIKFILSTGISAFCKVPAPVTT